MQAVSDASALPPPPVAASASDHADMLQAARRGVLLGLATLTLLLAPATPMRHSGAGASHTPAASTALTTPVPRQGPARFADFGPHAPSEQARHVADWVADSGDNGGADFILLDKLQATLYVFDAGAQLRGMSPVLLGAARGDDTVAGIGLRAIADVQPHERTTPAGRFVAERGRNALDEEVVWVDYDAAVSIHRVRATEPRERRLQRLATKTIADNRVSYGCINVPVTFFETVVQPTVASRRTIVYVLPEDRSAQQVFGSYDVAALRSAQRVLAQRS